MNLLIINQFADNKGDRAVLHVLVQLIRAVRPDARLVVSTTRPEAWKDTSLGQGENAIEFVPWSAPRSLPGVPARVTTALFRRWVYPSVVDTLLDGAKARAGARWLLEPGFMKALAGADLVISTGGHHFTNWFAKDGISPLFLDPALAILCKKPVYLWSQTLGPLLFSRKRNQDFLVKVLESCHGIYVRDQNSLRALAEVGLSSLRVVHSAESVFALDPPPLRPPSERARRVGIAVYGGPNRETMDFRRYVRILAGYVDFALEQGCQVVFFPMQFKDRPGDDRPLIREILAETGQPGQVEILEEDLPFDRHVREVSRCHVFVAHKTHAVVFSLATGTPTTSIAYHPKTADFMMRFGQGDRCIPEQELTLDWLRDMHHSAEQYGDALHGQQVETATRLRQEIRAALSGILGHFAGTKPPSGQG